MKARLTMTSTEPMSGSNQGNDQPVPFFKRCSLCGKEWRDREEFLADQTVILNGYQWNYHNVPLNTGNGGLLLFTHHYEHCGTTLALSASKFRVADKAMKKRKTREPNLCEG
jgi:hypothetical protein